MVLSDYKGWPLVSARLREAANIRAGVEPGELPRVFSLLFALADIAEEMERMGVDPLDDPRIGLIYAHAVILAAEITEEFNSRTRI